MLCDLIPETWRDVLALQFEMRYWAKLCDAVESAYDSSVVYPPKEQLFSALDYVSPADVRVVILGQDPYHEPGQAHGLAFSVPDGVAAPGSLQHIFQEIEMELGVECRKSGYLERWARQGVLMLNTTMTVEQGKAGSHRRFGWQKLTDSIIRSVSEQSPYSVFLLWGGDAHTKMPLIDSSRHLVICTTHPSGLSWGKTSRSGKMCGRTVQVAYDGVMTLGDGPFVHSGFGRNGDSAFWGSMQFLATNRWLLSRGYTEIDWR